MRQHLAPIKSQLNTRPDLAPFVLALAFNSVPLAGVAFLGWSPYELIFLYWLENVVIGVRTLISILLSGRFHGRLPATALGVFFSIHYGIFCFVHGMFVVTLFGGTSGANPPDAASFPSAMTIGVLAIIAWQGALLALHVIRRDTSTPTELMTSPYPRIVALHITIIAGGFLLMALDWPYAGIVLLAIIKTIMDAGIALVGSSVGQANQISAGGAITPPPSRP
jgi:uncharacterized protein YhhL (DUF1145 family)